MTTNEATTATSDPTCPGCALPLDDPDGHGPGSYWWCRTPDCGVIAHYVSVPKLSVV